MHKIFRSGISGRRTVFTSLPVFFVCFVAALLIDFYVYKRGYNWPPIRSDGLGYYLYLPAIFMHGDIFFNFLNDPTIAAKMSEYPRADWALAGLTAGQNGFTDKHPIGTAIMQIPFFWGAWAIAKNRYSAPLTGFEYPFQVASCLSAAFYFAAGACLLFRALLHRINISAAYFTILFTLVATNVLLYASYDGSFAHIYSFFLLSALCAVVVGASDTPTGLRSLGFGLLLGLAVIVRPTNVIAALLTLQLMANSPRRQIIRTIALVLCGGVLAASPQALIWLKTSGSLVHYSYANEGFDFLRPQLLDYLFSVRKGVFFWNPAYLFMILSLTAHYRKYPREALIFLAMILCNLYAGAAWHSWWFGGSFGSRQTIDILPVLAMATGSAISGLLAIGRPLLLYLSTLVATGLATVNLVQMHGYIVHEIPFDNTTPKLYGQFWLNTIGLSK